MGIAQFLKNKNVVIQLEFEEPHEIVSLQGVIVNANPIEGRKDIVSANVQFYDNSISIPYKIRINNFLTLYRKQDAGVRFEGEDPVVPVAAVTGGTAQPASSQTAPVQEKNAAPAQTTAAPAGETKQTASPSGTQA